MKFILHNHQNIFASLFEAKMVHIYSSDGVIPLHSNGALLTMEAGVSDDLAWGWSKNEPLPNISQHLFLVHFLPPYLQIAEFPNVNSIY